MMRMWKNAGLALVVVASLLAVKPVYADQPERTTIADVVVSANALTGEFSVLLEAILAADPAILATLDGKRQLTVFAPTDEAFGNLLAELGITAEDLLSDQALLTQVLLYHVAPGERVAADVLASERIRTLQRGFLFQSGGVLTDQNGRQANIIDVDIQADNGVIHVIDAVVLP